MMRKPNPFFAISGFLGGCIFIALAIIAFGGWSKFMSHPALIALTISGLLMSISASFTEGNLSSGVQEDRSNRWVLPVFGVVGILAAFIPPLTDRLNILTFGDEGVRWIGAFLFTAGGVLRMWPVFVLGRRFSGLVAIQPEHALVTDGIYATIRHPSYLGLLINSFGWALAFRSGLGIILTLLLLPPLVARMNSEEKLLRSHFGEEYDDFCKRTRWRLIPGLY